MSEIVQRVAWQRGQVLLPGHLSELENSIASEAAALWDARGLPGWGFVALSWDETAFANGMVIVEKLRWITPCGRVIDVPANAERPTPLKLREDVEREAEVYLDLFPPEIVPSSTGDSVDRLRWRLVLREGDQLPDPASRPTESVKMGHWETRVSESWAPVPSFVPPLLGIAETPYLRSKFAALRALLDGVDDLLRVRLGAKLPPDVRYAVQTIRAGCRRLLATLADVSEGRVNLHPYSLFEDLRDFAILLEGLGGGVEARKLPVYWHDDLGPRFHDLLNWITSMSVTLPIATSALRFEPDETPAVEFGPGIDVYAVKLDRE
jgi:predicted component of type VI protein secretion system